MGQGSSIQEDDWSMEPSLSRALLNDNYPTDLDITLRLDAKENANPFRNKYVIKLDSALGRDNIVIIFPHYPSNPYLFTARYSSLEKLSRDINERLDLCKKVDREFGVTNRNHIVWFRNPMGPIYLWWAQRINMETINSQENIIGHNIPVLVESNGESGYRNVYIFTEDRLLNIQDMSMIEPIKGCSLFCCDLPAPRSSGKTIRTLSEREANQITQDPVVRRLVTLEDERVPYSTTEDELIALDSQRFTQYDLGKGDLRRPDEEAAP